MSSVLPGKPEPRLQGLTTGLWENRNISAYITGKAITILQGTQTIFQTIYDDDDTPLEAICLDEWTGKLAACTNRQIRVYKPLGLGENLLKWTLESCFEFQCTGTGGPAVPSLSWGSSEELLVASNQLFLYSTRGEPANLWEKKLPNAVSLAALSYDSAYIASVGAFDRCPKVWRRLSYGQDQVRFDLTCLRHPDVVTSIRWRKPFHLEQAAENVLYTICLDCTVRIWVPTDTQEGQHWLLWGKVDVATPLPDAIASRVIKFVFVVDGRDFTASVERAVEARMADDNTTDDVALDHLVAVANRNPEICIAIDNQGLLCAWAFEDVGSSTAASSQIFSIAQVVSKQLETFGGFLAIGEDSSPHIQIETYCDKKTGGLHLLLHTFDGRIGVLAANVTDLFDPTTNDRRLALRSIWSGHSGSIQKIVRNFSGRAVISRTEQGESIVWRHALGRQGESTSGLTWQSIIPETGRIIRMLVLRKGHFVLMLKSDAISLWDCQYSPAKLLANRDYDVLGEKLCLINLPRPQMQDDAKAYIALLTSEGNGIVWQVNIPEYPQDPLASSGAEVEEFCRFNLDIADLAHILPVDSAGSCPSQSGFLDVFARDIALSYTHSGMIEFWTARINLDKRQVDWLSTCCTETGLSSPALVSGGILKKAALVSSNRSELTIWDIGSSRLEYDASYDTHSIIQDLDWTSTPDSQSILAVGFQYKVILLSQMRFDYLSKGPAWAPIRQITIRDVTPHPIGDSAWLGDGHLVIGAGNQMFVRDRSLDIADIPADDFVRLPGQTDGTLDMFEVVQRFNGPLPIFHPQFVSQCILAGKSELARLIAVELNKTLKYYVEGETMDSYLGIDLTEFYSSKDPTGRGLGRRTSAYLNGGHAEEDEDVFTEATATYINEKLLKLSIPQLSNHEQIQLADIIECMGFVEKHRRSMDENGARFMLFFRQNALRKGRTSQTQISWREFNWAFHSNSQDILVDFVSKQSNSEMLWERARESGIFMWLSDRTALRAQFEIVARNEYTKSDDKNPIDCSLYYLALKKKGVLQGLWRMATWNREQGATQKLLAQNFEDSRWKTAAMKNAYALLSKRRFEYAAAFFLLADRLEDAVEVCIRQMKDMQLAIAITRVYEGDDGPVMKKILHEEVLPLAAQEGNRWLASWAFWTLGRKDMAVRALITPVYALVETPHSPDYKSRLFLADDPALIVLYQQLRHQTLQTLQGASKITPKLEWEFVLHNARLYDRMGCDLIGLHLVRNWEFQQHTSPGLGGDFNPLNLLRRRSSLVVDDLSGSKLSLRSKDGGDPDDMLKIKEGLARTTDNKGKHGEKEKGPPTMFEEPEASSLLDSFGF